MSTAKSRSKVRLVRSANKWGFSASAVAAMQGHAELQIDLHGNRINSVNSSLAEGEDI